jgi:hypothetical protein
MKYWMGLVLAGCALVAIEELPPEAPSLASRPAPTATRKRMQVLRSEVQQTQALIQRLRWADSLPARLASEADHGRAVGAPPEIQDSAVAGIRRRLSREWTSLSTVDPHVLFGYYVQFRDQGEAPGVPTAPLSSSVPETMAGTVGGRPYCVTLALIARRDLARPMYARVMAPYRSESLYGLIGACRPFVEFGLPGPRIAEWLKDGGIAFAQADAAAQPDNPLTRAFRSWRPVPESAMWWTIPSSDVVLDGCFAGRSEMCRRIALGALQGVDAFGTHHDDGAARFVTERAPFYRVGDAHAMTAFGYPGRYLLADLERAYGPDEFRRFWTSNEDVPQAFQDAFGMDMGDWIVQWARANLYHYRAGPSLPRSAAGGGLLLLALCGTIAGAWATKRRVA